MNRFICIHGHFYQPPRENPWLERVELEDSASPYHDWNQKITAECYAPNTASRILNSEKIIVDMANNYSKISVNFGPTLLSWMQQEEPSIYEAIINADKESQKRYSGHGSALAQCYNHMIMPLASSRDKRTQILWGIKDFECRFGRIPEGMWLPETAVDLESLDLMAEQGIKFTILAPHQARRIRKINDKKWMEGDDLCLDTKSAYLLKLPSGRSINLFFYDGPLSHDIAFGRLLENGEHFAKRLLSGFNDQHYPQLMHIATDGETYGHHHRFGDMALAYCLHYLTQKKLAEVTIYSEHLEKFPPSCEVEIVENSSWSCTHGVERWRSNCGCSTGVNPQWNQEWRRSLREAMDWLRDNLARIYEEQMGNYFGDPWMARDEYIGIILDRSKEKIEQFMSRHGHRELTLKDKVKILKLLEMQRHAMLMFTSCGWFFDEVSGIETLQVMRYAARAMQLADEVCGARLEEEYIKLLGKAASNLSELKHGADIYRKYIQPQVLDLTRFAAHYAVSSLFEKYPQTVKIYSFMVERQDFDSIEIGKSKLAVGKVLIRSLVTWEEKNISFVVLHLGDQNLIAGVNESNGEDLAKEIHQEAKDIFITGDISRTIHLIEDKFLGHTYSLEHLFRDEQRKILNQILAYALKEVDYSLRQINQHHYPVMRAVRDLHVPLPRPLANLIESLLDTDFLRILEGKELDFNELQRLIERYKKWAFELDKTTLGFVASNRINAAFSEFSASPGDPAFLENIKTLLDILSPLSLSFDFWKSQNIYFSVGKQYYREMKHKAENGDENAKRWVAFFEPLGNYLRVKISE